MLFDKEGVIVTKDAWLEEVQGTDAIVGYARFTLNGDRITVFTRFTGLNHGDFKIWELGVTGNSKNTKHAGLHGRCETFTSLADAETAHIKAVADVKKAGGIIVTTEP